MCTGRIDLAFVFRALMNGADGVYIAGCRLNECNYITHGNYYALNMVLLSKKILEYLALNPERIRIEFMSSSDAQIFTETVSDFTKKIKDMGPLGEAEGLDEETTRSRIYKVLKLIPYIKIVMRNKLSARLSDLSEREHFFTREEIEKLFSETPSYYIDPEKCQACTICAQRCPVDAIDGGKNKIHIINQETCIRCGTCYDSCPPKFSAIKKLVGEAVPPPVPEEKRFITRK